MLHKILSPAKLNLDLKIISRRDDGYHNIRSTFQLIDYFDLILIEKNQHTTNFTTNDVKIFNPNNLCLKAANLIKTYTNTNCGANIHLQKNIPYNSGLGSGSSNAASVLINLNKIWQLDLSLDTLAELGVQIGADVPFFIYNQDAIVTGIGDIITPVKLKTSYFILAFPDIAINTSWAYNNVILNQDQSSNDFTNLLCQNYKEIAEFMDKNSRYMPRITGTGSCIFMQCNTKNDAYNIASKINTNFKLQVVKSLC